MGGSRVDVYRRPAGGFDTRFMGKQGMNILGGGGRGGGKEGGIVDCGSWSVPVPLERYEGEIYLGVRPEHVSLVAPDQGVGGAEVRGVEPLGPDTLVRVDAGGPALVARVHGIPDLRPGDRVGVKLDRRQLHLFDAAGARLP